MLHAVLIETLDLDERTLRRRIAALGAPRAWRLEPLERRWLLWLDDSAASARLCAALLRCAWVRRLDFAASAGQR